ncbi:evolutionarily conserved signaling intermediate in Toll pathway, mitochondrial [Venturia canescens]|uniref:evolutionarily conserved signaling intermediate in Toll pathway, mitochondrial n=1 Tax=Venturia canescens TaxID=32260 RepID=UPI001C9BE634|nr:evolutionarily conserved signaling intermediate in Toll pathway, mitochondrial [Venturia canescens]XP_043280953.1 evolutionarily conserved signaling intermediate in Toll pathway, mitochondrial [Venturia canescens]
MVMAQTRSRMYNILRSAVSLINHCSHRCNQIEVSSIFMTKRLLQTSVKCWEQEQKPKTPSRALVLLSFDNVKKKEKESFLDVLHTYESREPARKGHVEFIKVAMNYMDEFGVSEDLEIYKRLIDIMPKGRFISKSPMAADFMYYPKQQQIIIDLLEKMETNGVIPDSETELMLLNIFGQFGIPLRKFWRMMYWMPKFRNSNPWPTPRPVPDDAMVLARLAIEKISSVDVQTKITVFQTEEVADSIDKTWIVSAMSPEQEELLLEHPKNEACYVEGPYKVWVAHVPIDYFMLRAEPRAPIDRGDIDEDDISQIKVEFWNNPKNMLGPVRSVHEEEDATIYSLCATGTSSKDSLLSWVRCLQRKNPVLEHIPILFTFTGPVVDVKEITDGKPPKETPSDEESQQTGRIKDT